VTLSDSKIFNDISEHVRRAASATAEFLVKLTTINQFLEFLHENYK